METNFLLSLFIFIFATGLRAQTINWGSEVFSDIVESRGQTLDDAFIFEIGAFQEGFIPTFENAAQWHAHWGVFDRADYNSGIGYFTSTVEMNDDGSSNSPHASSGSPMFEGLEAFLWIRNEDAPAPTAEWMLARAQDWIFPYATADCCDNSLPIEWSVSDFRFSDQPVFGNQGGIRGAGAYTVTDDYTLQTFTFVPEPSSALLLVMAGSLAAFRRSRA